MNNTALASTKKGHLQKAVRVPVPIRLMVDDHKELKNSADNQQRSMSFIAMRRYLAGRDQEIPSRETYSDNSDSNIKGVRNVK